MDTLSESGALPSAWSTRQTLKNTRQPHSAKRARLTVHRQRLLCRVFIEHSTKSLPSARRYLAKKSVRHGDGWRRRWLCRVSPNTLGKEVTSLPSVCRLELGKGTTSGSLCQVLCRVSGPQHSAKKLYRCPGIASLPSAMSLTLGKVTSIHLFYLFFLFHLIKQKIHHIYHHIYTQISSQT
jgi:hypothetical protein